LALALALGGTALAEEKRATVGDFRLKTLSGKRAALSDYAGKVVVVNFWATWCVPCLQELPHLQEYYERLEKDGLVVLAITIDGPDTFAKVRQTVQRKKFTMPILLDQDGAVAAILNPRGTNPYTMFIDRRGRLAADHEGYNSGDEKKHLAIIEKLLAEK